MTALWAPNGHDADVVAPDDVVDGQPFDPIAEAERAMRRRIDDHAHSLRAELVNASNARMDLERLLAVAKSTERRIARAINALESDDSKLSRPPKAQSAERMTARTSTTSKKHWTVSEARVESVRRAFVHWWTTGHDGVESITKMQFARVLREQYHERIGDETIARVFDVLREREIVRKAGVTRGGGILWALMPGAADDAA